MTTETDLQREIAEDRRRRHDAEARNAELRAELRAWRLVAESGLQLNSLEGRGLMADLPLVGNELDESRFEQMLRDLARNKGVA